MQTPPLPFPLLLNLSQLNLPSKASHIAKSNDQSLLTQLSAELDIVNHSLLLQTLSSLNFWDATNPRCSSYLTHHSLLASFDVFFVYTSVSLRTQSLDGFIARFITSYAICTVMKAKFLASAYISHPRFLLFIQFYISTWIHNKCLILNKSMSEFLIPLT